MSSEVITRCDLRLSDHSYPMEPMDSLWSPVGLTLDDSDDFANAPTPFMADTFADLNDIESDDLLDLDIGQVDMGLVDNEVVVPINPVPDLQPLQPMTPVIVAQSSKRKFEEFYDDSDDDEDESPSVPRNENKVLKGRVGRKPSRGSAKCMSRNAIAARENREKKKAYVNDMEKRLRSAEDELKKKNIQVSGLIRANEDLEQQVRYLKGILANESTIGDLIRHMSSAKHIELVGTQFVSTEARTDSKADVKSIRKSHRIASKSETPSGQADRQTSGICFHIHNSKVSLELCSKCSLKHMSKGK